MKGVKRLTSFISRKVEKKKVFLVISFNSGNYNSRVPNTACSSEWLLGNVQVDVVHLYTKDRLWFGGGMWKKTKGLKMNTQQ